MFLLIGAWSTNNKALTSFHGLDPYWCSFLAWPSICLPIWTGTHPLLTLYFSLIQNDRRNQTRCSCYLGNPGGWGTRHYSPLLITPLEKAYFRLHNRFIYPITLGDSLQLPLDLSRIQNGFPNQSRCSCYSGPVGRGPRLLNMSIFEFSLL